MFSPFILNRTLHVAEFAVSYFAFYTRLKTHITGVCGD